MAAKKKVTKKKVTKKKVTKEPKPAKVERIRAIGPAIDSLGRLRELRLEMQKKVDALKQEEWAAAKRILSQLAKHQAQGAAGDVYQVTRDTQPIVKVEDWKKFYDWIFENRVEDALQHRPVVGALQEHAKQQGEGIPGIEFDSAAKLNLSKRSRK